MEDISKIKLKPLLSDKQIRKRVIQMGAEISKDYRHTLPLIICVLKGSMFFFADLIRAMDIDVKCDFIKASSYLGHMTPHQEVRLEADILSNVKDKNLLIVDDIVDRGKTLEYLIRILESKNPKSVTSCVLLSKPDCNLEKINLKYVGFEINENFVVGYGLDYKGYFRNLPYIAIPDLIT